MSHQQSLTQHSVFRPVKEALGGKTLWSDEEAEQMVHQWQHMQPEECFYLEIKTKWRLCRQMIHVCDMYLQTNNAK